VRVATCAIAYHEPRFITPHIQHIPDWVEEKLVLVTERPWQGEPLGFDETPGLAATAGATVMVYPWKTEEDQRNAGQEYLSDYDWVIVLDPDEFLSNQAWGFLYNFLQTAEADAYVVDHQRVFYKDKEVSPHTDYQMLIAVRPSVRFVDKRVVDCAYGTAPIELLHFSWARTDEEVLNKITHYAHAQELIPDWYTEVWKSDKTTDLHPKSPETLKALIEPVLPPEIEALHLWP
jgi:hypothetical protein